MSLVKGQGKASSADCCCSGAAPCFRGSEGQRVSAKTRLISCVLSAGGSGPPTEASSRHPWIMPRVWVPWAKRSLATFPGARARTGHSKDLGLLRKTAGTLTPMESHGQSLQKEDGGLSISNQSCSSSSCPRKGGRKEAVPRSPLTFEPGPVLSARKQWRIR